MDALTSARVKIDRGKEHLLPVFEEVRKLRGGKPYAVALDYKPDTRRQYFQITEFDPFDNTGLGLLVGDGIHNLRSALDHIAFGLAELNRGEPLPRKLHRNIYFPVTTNYPELIAHPTTPYLTLEQLTIVERYQPFDGRDDKRLRTLNDLWNADKHQSVQPVLVALPQSGIKFVPNEDAGSIVKRDISPKITFDSETKGKWVDMGWVEVEGLGPEPQVVVQELAIEIPLGKSRYVAEDLYDLPDFVQGIVEEFAQFF